MDIKCNYSALYDSSYEIARRYYIEHDKNIDGFKFYEGEIDFSEETLHIIKPSVYTLDMSQIFGYDSVKQTITDVVNSEKSINLILSGSCVEDSKPIFAFS